MQSPVEPRLLAPLSSPSEVIPLHEAGADALYAGYLSEDFRSRFTSFFGPNARPMLQSNFLHLSDLADALDRCRDRGISLEIAYNQPMGREGAKLALEEIRSLMDLGITRFTVSQPGLLRSILGANPDAEVTMSVLAGSSNRQALDFFARLGARRVTLVPQQPWSWIESLARHAATRSLDLAVFVLGALCPFVCAHCGFAHGRRSRRMGSALSLNRQLETLLAGAGSSPWRGKLHGLYEDLRGRIVARSGPPCYWPVDGGTGKPFHFRPHARASARACAACTASRLLELGAIRYWKVAGRDHVTGAKIRNLLFLRDVRALALAGHRGEELERLAREAHGRRLGRPCSDEICFAHRMEERE